jgi:transposase
VPPPRRRTSGRPSVLQPATGWIDAMLRADLTAPRKQRHTVERVRVRLATEHGFTAAYSTLAAYVARRRPQLQREARAGHQHLLGMVPQLHPPGAEAEVDFCEVWVRLAGVAVKCHLFTLRLSYSGKAVHRVFASAGQPAFLEGHVEAFRVLGGVPTGHIRYDNLKAAVKRVCVGRTRVESQRWVAFRSHFGFDAFYCLPGLDGAHEKGGVEHDGGRFRRTHLVPVPEVDTLAELNARLAAIDAAEDDRYVHGRERTVGASFAEEAALLAPLPDDDFDCGLTLTPTVRRNSRIVVGQGYYSVPARLIDTRVRVSLRANEVLVYDGAQVVARHPRLTRRWGYHDTLDHFLEVLLVKPGALAGSCAVAQARAEGTFTAEHEAFWAAARTAHGDAEGTRALIDVLLLHRRAPASAVLAGITATLRAGSTSPQVVAVEARRAEQGTAAAQAPADGLAVTAGLPADTRPPPSVAAYDQLLSHATKGHP